ncbi:hypothetical protein BDW59DRAFT_140379 [Aspergillus cavernicola]|uniref:Uncharacterized protein n=1 Tax=Aspergillus cavernicola TaxID=176166 RepID=A0ABR4ITL1_9EURO
MSGPYQKPSLNSSNPDSPLSPPPRDNTPVSFRPNVNRAKTRRWVEAKKYSYDGDDWGEDEYGEYEYDDDQPASQDQRPSVNRSTSDYASTLPKNTSRPPLPSMNSSRSMERAQTMPTESPAPSNSPPASIVRPADIYRRMREEQMAPQPAPVGPSTGEPPSATVTSPLTSSAPPEKSAIDFSYDGSYDGHGRESDYSVPAPTATNEPPALSLPDMKRLSAFSPDFSAERESNSQNQDSMSQPHELQHNPSLGFRSAVNQAFDVPETPSTIADSVARSNSDSTTAISPIIAHRSNTDLKTPTIEEEPNESIDTPTEDNLVFRPGHRRDLSLPSSGHSPSRKPIVNEPNACAPSELAHLSARTPSDSPLDVPQYPQQQSSDLTESVRQSQEMSSGRDLPPPLNVQTNVAPGPTVTAENVPVIIPSMSSDNSPEDTENDRLRKEIIRSLSRENTPSDQLDHGAPPETSKQDNLIPTEYESYWSEQQPAIRPGQEPSSSTFNPAQTASSLQAPAPISPQDAHKLQRRFSWEESSSEEDPTRGTQARPSRPPPMPGQFPFSQDNVHPDSFTTPTSQPSETVEHVGGRDESSPTPKKPKLTVVPPSAIVDAVSSPSSAQFHGSGHSQTTDTLARAEEGESFSPDRQSLEPPVQSSSASMDSGLLGFKDILGIQSSDERVKAFNRTRDQFAAIDTGLGHWVQFTIQAHPEHSDVIERNDKPLSDEFKNSVPRTKFPKLSSLGNLASSLQDGSHSTSGHIRRPSASLGSVKQNQVGKDFLHTAGVLGGHAGKAAKGLFSKGRSKLKGSGGTEKVEP